MLTWTVTATVIATIGGIVVAIQAAAFNRMRRDVYSRVIFGQDSAQSLVESSRLEAALATMRYRNFFGRPRMEIDEQGIAGDRYRDSVSATGPDKRGYYYYYLHRAETPAATPVDSEKVRHWLELVRRLDLENLHDAKSGEATTTEGVSGAPVFLMRSGPTTPLLVLFFRPRKDDKHRLEISLLRGGFRSSWDLSGARAMDQHLANDLLGDLRRHRRGSLNKDWQKVGDDLRRSAGAALPDEESDGMNDPLDG